MPLLKEETRTDIGSMPVCIPVCVCVCVFSSRVKRSRMNTFIIIYFIDRSRADGDVDVLMLCLCHLQRLQYYRLGKDDCVVMTWPRLCVSCLLGKSIEEIDR